MTDNILPLDSGAYCLGRHEKNWRGIEIRARFSGRELLALRAFYAGVPARLIRREYGDPWPVLARHRTLPKDLYEELKWELIALPGTQHHGTSRRYSPRPQPRWRKCPHCESWIEKHDWRPARLADAWIGHKSGCMACYRAKVAAYQQRKEQSQEAGHENDA